MVDARNTVDIKRMQLEAQKKTALLKQMKADQIRQLKAIDEEKHAQMAELISQHTREHRKA